MPQQPESNISKFQADAFEKFRRAFHFHHGFVMTMAVNDRLACSISEIQNPIFGKKFADGHHVVAQAAPRLRQREKAASIHREKQ